MTRSSPPSHLPRIRLLQIGDIHLPTAAEKKGVLDNKDPRFPLAVTGLIAHSPLRTVFRAIYALLADGQADCVLFMGDLADIGRLDAFDACCRYIAEALQLGNKGTLADIAVGIVPGNHDVNRELAKTSSLAKFAPLNAALSAHGLPRLPVQSPIEIPLSKGSSRANIHLVNSCWGCGEEEYIPEIFRKPIAEAIEAALKGADKAKAIRLYYDRQLDTPAISLETLSEVVGRISSAPVTHLPVIVAHHNLLPQRIPRLAPYTELVNSGAFRMSLEELARPVIYMHGHLHDGPIEILQSPKGAPLVLVSAPEVVMGFNVVDVIFTPAGLPLACHVRPWRFDGSGILREFPIARACLLAKRRRATNSNLGRIYGKLLEHGQCYWQQAVDVSQQIVPGADDAWIIEQLELLLADDCIEIENYEMDYTHWIMRAEL